MLEVLQIFYMHYFIQPSKFFKTGTIIIVPILWIRKQGKEKVTF